MKLYIYITEEMDVDRNTTDKTLMVYSGQKAKRFYSLNAVLKVHSNRQKLLGGTQQNVSVTYLFGRPLIPYNFLRGIFTSNFRDMGNLRPSVFGLIKTSFRVPEKENRWSAMPHTGKFHDVCKGIWPLCDAG